MGTFPRVEKSPPRKATNSFSSSFPPKIESDSLVRVTSKEMNQKAQVSDDEDFALFEKAQEKIDKLHGGLKPAYSNSSQTSTPCYKKDVKHKTLSGSSTSSN